MKQSMKRLLAVVLVAVMFLSVGEGISLNMKSVSAEETSSASSDVKNTLFAADFVNTIANDSSSTLKKEGWTKYSGLTAAGGVGASNSRVNIASIGDNQALQLTNNGSGAAASWVQKDVDVTALDNVTVEYQYYVDCIATNGSAERYTHTTLRYIDATSSTGDGIAAKNGYSTDGWSTLYYVADSEKADVGEWIRIKTVITKDSVTGNWKSTAYKYDDGDGTWKLYGNDNNTTFKVGEDNLMHLCFLAYARKDIYSGDTSGKTKASGYIDDVNIYTTQEVVVEEELFAADFANSTVNDTSSTLKTEGWTKYSGLAAAGGVGASNSRVYSTSIDEDKVLQLTTNGSGAASSWVQKDVDVTGLDNVTVEYQYYIDCIATNGSAERYTHTTLRYIDATSTTGDGIAAKNGYSADGWSTLYYVADSEKADVGEWIRIKAVITKDSITGTWKSTAYKYDDGEGAWKPYGNDNNTTFKVGEDNLMHLCFLAYARKDVYSGDTSGKKKASSYIDNVSIYTSVNKGMFAADFANTTANDSSSTLKAEGWTKYSGLAAAGGVGASNSRVNIASIGDNQALQLTNNGSGAAASWVQKDVDVTGLDNVTVEYEYYVDCIATNGSAERYTHTTLRYIDATSSTGDGIAAKNGYSTDGWSTLYYVADSEKADVGEWIRIKAVITKDSVTGNWYSTAYKYDDGDGAWKLYGNDNNTTFKVGEDNLMHLCFLAYARKDIYSGDTSGKTKASGYIDNVNIYTMEHYTDGTSEEYTLPTMVRGASVRLVEDSSGIRFAGQVDKAYVDALKENSEISSVKYGVIITPEQYINEKHSDFTMRKLAKKYSVNPYLKIEGEKVIDNGDTYEFRCAMIGIGEALYGWEFAARSYIEIQYADGSNACLYSGFASETNVRSIQEVAKSALEYTSQECSDVQVGILLDYLGDTQVYLSTENGNDENAGKYATPVKTLGRALELAEERENIIIKDTCTVEENFSWPTINNTVTIKGATGAATNSLNFENVGTVVNINSNVTFDNLKIKWASGAYIYGNGHEVTFSNGVTTDGTYYFLFGGGASGTTVESTHLTVLGGNFKRIYGGSNGGTVTGDTYLYIGGTANKGATPSKHSHDYAIYGGGCMDTVDGDTYVTFTDSAKANYVYGGSDQGSVRITNVTFSGGQVMCLHGGNNSGSVSGVNVIVSGGEMEQLFGGNLESSMTGDITIDLQGGKITRRIYGGCYNDSFFGSNYVTGNINLNISSGVNISFDATDPDTGSKYEDMTIDAGSRYKSNSAEKSTITFVDEEAYNLYNSSCQGYDALVKSYE